MRKIVQIAEVEYCDFDGDVCGHTYGLCDDGTVWRWNFSELRWMYFPEMSAIPQTPLSELQKEGE